MNRKLAAAQYVHDIIIGLGQVVCLDISESERPALFRRILELEKDLKSHLGYEVQWHIEEEIDKMVQIGKDAQRSMSAHRN